VITKAQEIEGAVLIKVHLEKCTRQFALIAEVNAKFHSSHQGKGLFTAGNVLENTGIN
jgi:3-deoxy-D-arabino-heptulosonate 7-phosphate (DAHP) synthase class II